MLLQIRCIMINPVLNVATTNIEDDILNVATTNMEDDTLKNSK